MAIKPRDEILESVRSRLGENMDDDSIAFLEDITDTLSDLEEKASGENDWKQKYEENDRAWRKKYTERFFNKETEPTPGPEPEPESVHPKTFADLFTQD